AAISRNGFSSCQLIAEVYADDGFGHPTGSAIVTGTKAFSGLPSYPSFIKAIVPVSGGSLSAGVSYVVVWNTVQGTGGACFVDGSAADVCADGHASQALYGGPWTDDVDPTDGSSTDLFFATLSNP